MIHVCVPVLKRYDLLRALLLSLGESRVPVDCVWIIDNGRDEARLSFAIVESPVKVTTITPDKPMGVAESWNYFIENVPEERIICNDDIEFGPYSIESIISAPEDLVWAGFGFACFLIRDSCVAKIGKFDETISPGYGYYEDEDYLQRLDGRGTRERSATATNVYAGLRHIHSGTLKASSHAELLEHHRRFLIAQGNYAKKWGVTF